MRIFTAVLLGKMVRIFLRTLKLSGGSAAPGLYALKIHPQLIENLISHVPLNVVITGTNGKTTTARMLAHMATQAGLKVIRNSTGSNLERGIASTLISCVHLSGANLNYDLGIWELDEAAFNSVAPKLNPDIVVFLNISRDQLDRYGEIDSVIKKWKQTLKSISHKTTIILNTDDRLINSLATKAVRFGVKASDFKINGLEGSTLRIKVDGQNLTAKIPIPGIYNVYNFLAAFSASRLLGLKPDQAVKSLAGYNTAFGRAEKLDFGYIFLIKNPAGATQVFETLAPQLKKEDKLLLALNDNLADGKDVSWIWDSNFEKLRTTNSKLQTICSGTRAYDLALRLKYAGFEPKQIKVEPSLEKALKQATSGLKGKLFVLPTYTAMLELQRILAKTGIKKHYWEEL